MKTILHDPNARLDYEWDWSEWIKDGETIVTAVVTVEPDDGVLVVEAATFSGVVVTAWVSGGEVGKTYLLPCHVTTNSGREDDRTMILKCENR